MTAEELAWAIFLYLDEHESYVGQYREGGTTLDGDFDLVALARHILEVVRPQQGNE